MIKIVLASRNPKKIIELKKCLAESAVEAEVLSLDDIGYHDEIIEDGTTFEENSLIKASVPAKLGYIGVADDSGLSVDALGGAPGVYSARYGGEDGNDEKNKAKLLSEMANVPDGKRGAHFVTVVTCAFPDGSYFQTRGTCEGEILRAEVGKDGFGYDPLFFFPPYDKSFAQISREEKNAVSHRGKAMRAFADKFAEYLKKRENENADK